MDQSKNNNSLIDIIVPLCNGIPFDLFWSVGGTFAGEVRIEVITSKLEIFI